MRTVKQAFAIWTGRILHPESHVGLTPVKVLDISDKPKFLGRIIFYVEMPLPMSKYTHIGHSVHFVSPDSTVKRTLCCHSG
jgi:hypothetical protein